MTARLRQTIRLLFIAAFAVMAALQAQAVESGYDEFYVNTMRGLGRVSPNGTRSAAMAGTGRGLADGVASLGVNPGALGAFQGSGVDIGLGVDWLDDGHDDAEQISFRIGGATNLDRWTDNACVRNQAIGGLLTTESYSGAAGNAMKRNQTGVLFGYGVHLLDNILVGGSVALFNGKWNADERTADNFPAMNRKFVGGDFKVGGIYRVQDETTFGGTIGYTTGSYRELGETAAGTGSLERLSIGAGFAHQYARCTMFMGDIWYESVRTELPSIAKERNKAWGLGVGVEQRVVPDMLALRGGLYYDHNSYSSNGGNRYVGGGSFSKGRFGVTAGAGLRLYNFDLGYSLDVKSNGSIKNMLDFSTEW